MLNRRLSRRGVTIFESVAGLVVIGVVMTLATRAAVTIDRGRRVDRQERVAIETLRNTMERATALPWGELSEDRLDELLAGAAPAGLPEASLEAEVVAVEEPVPGKRLSLALSWRATPGAPPMTRSLRAWVYAGKEGAP